MCRSRSVVIMGWVVVAVAASWASEGKRSLEVELSYSHVSGTVDRQGLSYGLTLSGKPLPREAEFRVRGNWAKDRGRSPVADDTRVDLIYTGPLVPTLKPYVKATYARNPPWGYRHQVRVGAGVVQTWFPTRHGPLLQTRTGYQYRGNRFSPVWDLVEGAKPSSRQHCALLGARTQIPLYPGATVHVSADYEPSLLEGENYYAEVDGSLRVQVHRKASLALVREWAYQAVPLPGKPKTDAQTSVRLVVSL